MARAELRRQAGVASELEPTSDTEKKMEAKAQEAAALDDPGKQFAVLHPGGVNYTLHLSDPEREKVIELPNALSIKDVLQRRVLEDLESLALFIRAQVQEMVPDEVVDSNFVMTHMGLYEAAMVSSGSRSQARKIVAKVARVPVAEIEAGMSRTDLMVATLFLFNRMSEEVARASKNGQGTASE